MGKFKIIFPSGYLVENLFNDNIDLNIVTKENKVFAASAFTLANIQSLMEKDEYDYFWSSDMFIVDNLRFETLFNAVNKIIDDGYTELIFKSIGTIHEVYGKKAFEEVEEYKG